MSRLLDGRPNSSEDTLDSSLRPLTLKEYVGQKDLKDHVLRMVGNPDQRLKEDPLRILRAIRFHLMYKLTIEKSLWEAMRDRFYLLENLTDAKIKSEVKKIDESKVDPKMKKEIYEQFDVPNIKGVVK